MHLFRILACLRRSWQSLPACCHLQRCTWRPCSLLSSCRWLNFNTGQPAKTSSRGGCGFRSKAWLLRWSSFCKRTTRHPILCSRWKCFVLVLRGLLMWQMQAPKFRLREAGQGFYRRFRPSPILSPRSLLSPLRLLLYWLSFPRLPFRELMKTSPGIWWLGSFLSCAKAFKEVIAAEPLWDAFPREALTTSSFLRSAASFSCFLRRLLARVDQEAWHTSSCLKIEFPSPADFLRCSESDPPKHLWIHASRQGPLLCQVYPANE